NSLHLFLCPFSLVVIRSSICMASLYQILPLLFVFPSSVFAQFGRFGPGGWRGRGGPPPWMMGGGPGPGPFGGRGIPPPGFGHGHDMDYGGGFPGGGGEFGDYGGGMGPMGGGGPGPGGGGILGTLIRAGVSTMAANANRQNQQNAAQREENSFARLLQNKFDENGIKQGGTGSGGLIGQTSSRPSESFFPSSSSSFGSTSSFGSPSSSGSSSLSRDPSSSKTPSSFATEGEMAAFSHSPSFNSKSSFR
ncbi:hypothetical protein PMAYCL1PPCAC_30881, partial [Pristionchus mayeri]